MTPPRARATQAAKSATVRQNGQNGHGAVFDLDAYQAEAVREPYRFILGGQTFELPHLLDMDWHASTDEAIVADMVRAALGDQWAAFDGCELTAGGYNELWRRWKDHSGTDPGESGASPGS